MRKKIIKKLFQNRRILDLLGVVFISTGINLLTTFLTGNTNTCWRLIYSLSFSISGALFFLLSSFFEDSFSSSITEYQKLPIDKKAKTDISIIGAERAADVKLGVNFVLFLSCIIFLCIAVILMVITE